MADRTAAAGITFAGDQAQGRLGFASSSSSSSSSSRSIPFPFFKRYAQMPRFLNSYGPKHPEAGLQQFCASSTFARSMKARSACLGIFPYPSRISVTFTAILFASVISRCKRMQGLSVLPKGQEWLSRWRFGSQKLSEFQY